MLNVIIFYSDKYGRKKSVVISMMIMTFATSILIILCFYPNMSALFGGGAIFGIGYGIVFPYLLYIRFNYFVNRCISSCRLGITDIHLYETLNSYYKII